MTSAIPPSGQGEPPLKWRALTPVEYSTQTRPLLVEAERPHEGRSTWVMKRRSVLGGVGSAVELMAARLARAIGVRVPDFAVIEVRPSDVEGLSGANRARIEREVGMNFGSLFLKGYVDVHSPGDVGLKHKEQAESVFAFDVACDNADRTDQQRAGSVRSNLLIGDEGLVAIDHQNTFAWYFLIGGQPTWTRLITTRAYQEHFLRSLISVPCASLGTMREVLVNLDGASLDRITGGLPDEWLADGAERCAERVRTFLEDVIRKADDLFASINEGTAHA